jgi:hypothetical protein
MTGMHWHSIDYKRDRDENTRSVINRGFWIFNTPRLMPLCRLRGHRPVVDGVDHSPMHNARGVTPGRRSRWAVCDRCGLRLQQPIDSDLQIGQPYTDELPPTPEARGELGGQLVIGRNHGGWSAEVKVGNAGSEHAIAAHLHLHHLGALYLNTEKHGTWLQRRLNSTGYDSRVIGLSLHDGLLTWNLWAKRDSYSRTDPWWMHRSVQIGLRDRLFGPLRYSYTDVGQPVTATVRMAAGDDHKVILQLQRQSLGRKRLRHRELSWIAGWSTPRTENGSGIPTRAHRGGVTASGVELAASTDPDALHWVDEACAAIAAKLTRDRARYGFKLDRAAA